MSRVDLANVFDGLVRPIREEGRQEVFSVASVGPHVRIGKSARNEPAFLVAVRAGGDVRPIAVSLPNLRARHRCQLSVIDDHGNTTSETLSVIECLSEERALQELFMIALGHVLPQSDEGPTAAEVEGIVDHLVELFRGVGGPGEGSTLGLWGELFLICQSASPKLFVRAWHVDPQARVDFATETERIEVKTTTRADRVHSFSLEQLAAPLGGVGVVASVMTQELPEGTTVGDLWEERLTLVEGEDDLRGKIDRLCIRALGRDWKLQSKRAFDRRQAEESWLLFDVHDIPKVGQVPPSVARVRFEADLRGSSSLLVDDIRLSSSVLIAQLNW